MSNSLDTADIQKYLELHRAGDKKAGKELVVPFLERLRALAERMMKSEKFAALRRWESAEDVYQDAVVRLLERLETFQPKSRLHFYNITATLLRCEFVNLMRHYFGEWGAGANHHSSPLPSAGDNSNLPPLHDPGTDSSNPALLAEWTELHRFFEELPEPEKSIADLHYIHGMTIVQTARELGRDESTVRKYLRRVRLKLSFLPGPAELPQNTA